jgi:hypothetical protein
MDDNIVSTQLKLDWSICVCCIFQLKLCVAQTLFDLEPWNFTEMLVMLCSCVRVDLFSICRGIALDLA